MQNQGKEIYIKTQRSVLALLVALIIFCVCCAYFSNVALIKGVEPNAQKPQNNNAIYKSDKSIAKCVSTSSNYVRIGGYPIGISVKTNGLIVVDSVSVDTPQGMVSPSAQIRKGDIILSLNGERVQSIYRLKEILSKSKDGVFNVEYSRGGLAFTTLINCAKDKSDGLYKLGLSLKADVGGIGTMTFVTQDGKFASLGHHIQDGDSLVDDELDRGNIYDASVSGVVKGERGKAGGLVAEVNRFSKSIGNVSKNTQIGLYGDYVGDSKGELYRIAQKGEAKLGKARVLTTIDGSNPKFYDIEIVKVVSQNSPEQKGMVISVNDDELLEKTGGIVQGMSGSPIVQNGVLIGAVTHVFVQDPTRGYAVHARFMYDMANGLQISDNLPSSMAA